MTSDLIVMRSEVLERLAAYGLDLAHVIHEAGIPSSRFRAAKVTLSTHEFFAFWRAVEASAPVRCIGLKLGSQTQRHHLDVASLAVLHSPNLGEALTKLARYKRLCLPEEVAIDVAHGEARVTFHWIHAEHGLPMTLVDGTFAHVLALAREGIGTRVMPLRVELARRRADQPVLARHFGCDIVFDAPVDVLVLDAADLARPFRRRNAGLYELLIPGLESAFHESSGSATLVDDVRGLLRRGMCGERPSVEKVAAMMRLSPRTLQRRLGEQGTSYQKLLDHVRDSVARRLLAETDLQAGEIAFLLGFDELNSFSRAFHVWAGATPARWRRFHRDSAATRAVASVPAAAAAGRG